MKMPDAENLYICRLLYIIYSLWTNFYGKTDFLQIFYWEKLLKNS